MNTNPESDPEREREATENTLKGITPDLLRNRRLRRWYGKLMDRPTTNMVGAEDMPDWAERTNSPDKLDKIFKDSSSSEAVEPKKGKEERWVIVGVAAAVVMSSAAMVAAFQSKDPFMSANTPAEWGHETVGAVRAALADPDKLGLCADALDAQATVDERLIGRMGSDAAFLPAYYKDRPTKFREAAMRATKPCTTDQGVMEYLDRDVKATDITVFALHNWCQRRTTTYLPEIKEHQARPDPNDYLAEYYSDVVQTGNALYFAAAGQNC